MHQPNVSQDLPRYVRPRINQINVDTVAVEVPHAGFSMVVPRAQAPADGILDPRQTFVVEGVPGQPNLCVVRWWYGLEECVSRDRIPRVAIAQLSAEGISAGQESVSATGTGIATRRLSAGARARAGTRGPTACGSHGALLCPDERRPVACACGRRELARAHSPTLVAGTCRDCLPGRPTPPAEPLYYPHLCFSTN